MISSAIRAALSPGCWR
jgi:hypothetical protein